MQKIWKDYGAITIGTILIGLATKNIFDPASMVTGGVSGIAIIGKELWNLPLWVTNTVLNIPLFLAGFKIMGWKFIKRTLYATVLLSVAFYILPEGMYIEDDLLLSALFGGIITGVGTGLVLAGGCTTGGTDMLAALIRAKFPHYSVAQIMQVLDGLVVVAGATVFGIRAALYALIEGMKFSKQVYIISDKYKEISDAIMTRMGRGVTGLAAKGMYSDETKNMLFCVVSRKEIVEIKEIVSEYDPKAFFIVSDAREVFGEGFIEDKNQLT